MKNIDKKMKIDLLSFKDLLNKLADKQFTFFIKHLCFSIIVDLKTLKGKYKDKFKLK